MGEPELGDLICPECDRPCDDHDDDCVLVQPPGPCPMGCGRTTEDPYGGPCKACWEKV